ncbi:hypothetical protein [Mycobacterium sp. SA01]|uniref:hypothetical protein n=1 Tax=Mycobacterium sp. SA01 TaxID=3238820 RepID=UPI00351BA1AB
MLNKVADLPGELQQGRFPKIPDIPLPPIKPNEIPKGGTDIPPLHPDIPPPLPGQGLSFPQRQLAKFIGELEEGTFAEKQVKKAACRAMRDQISDPDDKRDWMNRIYSYLPSNTTQAERWSLDPIVDNVAGRLAAIGSDYGPVYVIACRF